MKVECAQCRTGYEFDDALVSRRGTTVRCTGCGHVFRVRRETPGGAPDRWWVRRRGGVVIEMETLRSLQRALSRGEVSGEDELEREGFAPRRIDTIAELSPFVRDKVSRTSSAVVSRSTQPDFGPETHTPRGSADEADGGAFATDEAATVRDISPFEGESAAPSLPIALSVPEALEGAPGAAEMREPTAEPERGGGGAETRERNARESGESDEHFAVAPESRADGESARPSDSPGAHAAAPRDDGRPRLGTRRSSRPERQRRGRLAFVGLALGIAAVAGAVGVQLGKQPSPSEGARAMDASGGDADALVVHGDRALARGDLETAREVFERAARTYPEDRRVAAGHLRSAVRLADERWLAALARSARRVGGPFVAPAGLLGADLAQSAAVVAGSVASSELCALLADASRLEGQLSEAARRLASCDTDSATLHYARAALALQTSPREVEDATFGELAAARAHAPDARRARAALIIALTTAGQGERACHELDALEANPPSRELLDSLHQLCGDAGPSVAVADRDSGADGGGRDGGGPNELRDRPTPGVTARDLVRDGRRATARGDIAAARSAYLAALDRSPEDPEALTGIAELAAREGDTALATDGYRRVIRSNPRYLPARLALADLLWSRDDTAAASGEYQDIVDRFAEASYPPRVRARARGASVQE